jgi:hypothetical protein
MFRKKQKPANPGRNVQRQKSANVFSYYNSRSPAENNYARRSSEQNPAEKKRPKTRWFAYLPSIFAGLALIACMVFVSTLSPTPKMKVIGAETSRALVGNPASYESEIRAIMERSVLNRSKLLVNTDKLAREIMEAYPELGDVAVVLPLVSRRPVVEILPAEPALVLASSTDTFVIDEKGRAVAFARDVESSIRDKLPVVQDESGVLLERGRVVLTSEAIDLIAEVSAQLSARKVSLQSMILPTTANELYVRIKDKPYYVKFDLRGEGRQQAGAFLAVKEHLEKEKKTPKEYIDVRVPGKAFYR